MLLGCQLHCFMLDCILCLGRSWCLLLQMKIKPPAHNPGPNAVVTGYETCQPNVGCCEVCAADLALPLMQTRPLFSCGDSRCACLTSKCYHLLLSFGSCCCKQCHPVHMQRPHIC